jgi:hypothetical protein
MIEADGNLHFPLTVLLTLRPLATFRGWGLLRLLASSKDLAWL